MEYNSVTYAVMNASTLQLKSEWGSEEQARKALNTYSQTDPPVFNLRVVKVTREVTIEEVEA